MEEPFDFEAFMQAALTPDKDTKRALQDEGVAEAMDATMGEVAPRIWQILIKEMKRDSKNNLHLNAVVNSAVFSVLSFIASVTPAVSTDGRDNDAMLREKVMSNLESALLNGRDSGVQIAQIAGNVGELKLLQDSNATLSKIIVLNSTVLQAVAARLKQP